MTAAGTSAMSSADQFSYFLSASLPTNLSAVSGSGTFGGTATLTSTLTASAVPLAGRTVIFTLSEGGTVRTVGTATTDANGVATLTGVSLAGLDAGMYSGAVLASFAGDSTYAASSASGTLVVNATTPLIIIGEQPLFHRKTNKKGKPIGKPVLSGFVFDFSQPLNPSSAANSANYQVDTITTKRVKKQTRHILHPITSFSVAYSAANDSVTLTFAGKQTFRTGGQITVVGGSPSGVTGSLGRRAGRKSGVHDLTAWPEHRRSVSPGRPRRIDGSTTGGCRKIETQAVSAGFHAIALGLAAKVAAESVEIYANPCDSCKPWNSKKRRKPLNLRQIGVLTVYMARKTSGVRGVFPFFAFLHASEIPNGDAAPVGDWPAELGLRPAACAAAPLLAGTFAVRGEGGHRSDVFIIDVEILLLPIILGRLGFDLAVGLILHSFFAPIAFFGASYMWIEAALCALLAPGES